MPYDNAFSSVYFAVIEMADNVAVAQLHVGQEAHTVYAGNSLGNRSAEDKWSSFIFPPLCHLSVLATDYLFIVFLSYYSNTLVLWTHDLDLAQMMPFPGI